jgi:hypothetical protein
VGFIVEKTCVSRNFDGAPGLRHTALKLAALTAIGALMLVWFLNKHERPDFSDFKVYWIAGQKAARHLTVYDVQGHYQFKYSPFVALLWSVPSMLPG